MSHVQPGINDIKTINPLLAEQWDYEKNNGIRPDIKNNIGLYRIVEIVAYAGSETRTTTEYGSQVNTIYECPSDECAGDQGLY